MAQSLVLVPDQLVSRKVKIPMTCFEDINGSGRAFTHQLTPLDLVCRFLSCTVMHALEVIENGKAMYYSVS